MNSDAIYYINKLIALGMEAQRLQDECAEKTGIRLCGLGAKKDYNDGRLYVQTYDCIEEIGLPVIERPQEGGGIEKSIEINGYRIIEV